MARAMNRRLDLKSRQYQHTLLSGKSAVKERSISLRSRSAEGCLTLGSRLARLFTTFSAVAGDVFID